MNIYNLLAACLLLMSPLAASAQHNLIIPGSRIGAVRLAEDMKEVYRQLGASRGMDAAMGHFIECWTGPSTASQRGPIRELDIYSVRNSFGDKVFVEEIRVNSPAFHTRAGIRTGASLSRILAVYPHLVQVRLNSYDDRVAVYDDASHGIAFEFARASDGSVDLKHCSAILVHSKNRSVTATYSPLAGRPFGSDDRSE